MMIVEDEWLFASDLQEQLTALRYEVVALMASGEEAISKVESAHPDVAIMDVGLAGIMKGTETASSAPAQKLRCAKSSGTPRSFRTSARVWLPEKISIPSTRHLDRGHRDHTVKGGHGADAGR